MLIAEYCIARLNSTLMGSFAVSGEEISNDGTKWIPNLTIHYDCHTGGLLTGVSRYLTPPVQDCQLFGAMFSRNEADGNFVVGHTAGPSDVRDPGMHTATIHEVWARAVRVLGYHTPPEGFQWSQVNALCNSVRANERPLLDRALGSTMPDRWVFVWMYQYFHGTLNTYAYATPYPAPELFDRFLLSEHLRLFVFVSAGIQANWSSKSQDNYGMVIHCVERGGARATWMVCVGRSTFD